MMIDIESSIKQANTLLLLRQFTAADELAVKTLNQLRMHDDDRDECIDDVTHQQQQQHVHSKIDVYIYSLIAVVLQARTESGHSVCEAVDWTLTWFYGTTSSITLDVILMCALMLVDVDDLRYARYVIESWLHTHTCVDVDNPLITQVIDVYIHHVLVPLNEFNAVNRFLSSDESCCCLSMEKKQVYIDVTTAAIMKEDDDSVDGCIVKGTDDNVHGCTDEKAIESTPSVWTQKYAYTPSINMLKTVVCIGVSIAAGSVLLWRLRRRRRR